MIHKNDLHDEIKSNKLVIYKADSMKGIILY